ncbi:unnamed protein product [Ascophyllum nodosum]
MESNPAIEQLILLSRRIAQSIGLRPGGEITSEDVAPLVQLVSTFTPEHLGLVPQAHAYITPATAYPTDIRYLHMAQEAGFSIGVFVLPPGACMPLHDHPNMCVVSHVLYGSVKITSYDRLQADSDSNASRLRGSNQQGGQPQLASLRESGWHNAPHTSRLSPGVANIHELEAGGDGTAILDVLIPPYDDASGRECTYYRAEHTGGAWVRLVPCNPGDQFRIMRGTLVSPYSYSK